MKKLFMIFQVVPWLFLAQAEPMDFLGISTSPDSVFEDLQELMGPIKNQAKKGNLKEWGKRETNRVGELYKSYRDGRNIEEGLFACRSGLNSLLAELGKYETLRENFLKDFILFIHDLLADEVYMYFLWEICGRPKEKFPETYTQEQERVFNLEVKDKGAAFFEKRKKRFFIFLKKFQGTRSSLQFHFYNFFNLVSKKVKNISFKIKWA